MDSLVINTKNHCFLCLNGQETCDKTQSLKTLCHYLKINVGKLLTSVNTTIDSCANLGKVNVEVNLCLRCDETLSKVTGIFRLLELLQMEMNDGIKNVKEIVDKSEDNQDAKVEYLRAMNGDLGCLLQLEIVNKLRQTLQNECSKKILEQEPRVRIKPCAPISERSQPEVRRIKVEVNADLEEDNLEDEDSIGSDEDLFIPVQTTEADNIQPTQEASRRSTETENHSSPNTSSRKSTRVKRPTKRLVDFLQESFLLTDEAGDLEMQVAAESDGPSGVIGDGNIVENGPYINVTEAGASKLEQEANSITMANGKIKCKRCANEFSSQLAFKYHYEAVHLRIRYGCKVCGKQISCKQYLAKHEVFCSLRLPKVKVRVSQKISRNTSGVRYNCEFCKNSFYSKHYLKRHSARCSRGEIRKSKLVEFHSNQTDSGKLKCKYCQMEFDEEDSLKIHLRSTHPAFLHPCEFCNKQFASSSSLWAHIHKKRCKSVAGGEAKIYKCNERAKIYKCNQCDKSFTFKANLNRHNKNAHGEKRFKCKVCNRMFRLWHHLVVHERAHQKGAVRKTN